MKFHKRSLLLLKVLRWVEDLDWSVLPILLLQPKVLYSLPETSLGIPPAQIALIERLGMPKTRKLALTGARLSGEEI